MEQETTVEGEVEASDSPAEAYQEASQEDLASPSSAPDEQGGENPETFTKEQVSEIVAKRVNDLKSKSEAWSKLGKSPEEVANRLERLKGMESMVEGKPDAVETPTLKPEEQQFKEYMTKMFPGIDKVGDIQLKTQELETGVQGISQKEFMRHAEAGSKQIANMAKEIGIDDGERVKYVEDLVAFKLRQDPEAYEKFFNGDLSVIGEKFAVVKSEFLNKFLTQGDQAQSKNRGKTASLPPKMPPGGVPAPTSKSKKMNDEERAAAGYQAYFDAGGTK